ncbi:osteoclast stimulatory transmembrane protein-like [Carassius carassius]|uniref:osteoclast stimulatory transmembrane protein-like n=1 Tax=Carassius carassius TaxID=217509 RepID=UPI0028688602|nr:osteoclast stimulatory transmembrane protein-like [Carassius carassius]
MTIFLIVLDHFLYYLVKLCGPWISNMPSTNIGINVNFKVGAEVGICQIFSLDSQVELLNFNRTYTARIHSDPNVCEAQSSKLNPGVVTALLFLYLFSYALLPLEVYARRLRRKVAASFFQAQEGRRVEFLIEKIQTKQKERQNEVFFITKHQDKEVFGIIDQL